MFGMSKYANKKTSCPVETTLNVIGKKWTVLIIRDLLKSTMRFGELLKSLHGISPRTLSARLSELEEYGVLKKKVYPVIPLKVEYSLDKKGYELRLILDQMSVWGSNY